MKQLHYVRVDLPIAPVTINNLNDRNWKVYCIHKGQRGAEAAPFPTVTVTMEPRKGSDE